MSVGFIFTGIGALVAGIGLVIWLNTRRFLEDSLEAEGTVVGMNRSAKGGYAPVFEYRAGGRPIRIAESLYSSPPQYSVGDKVPIRYDPENPERARIDQPFHLYFAPVLLGGVGLIFFVVGVLLWIAELGAL